MDTDFLASLPQMALSYLPKLALALLTLLVGSWAIGWVTQIVNAAFRKRDFDPTVQRFLSSLVNVALKVMLLLSVAGMFGVQTTSFIAIFTALAFAIGSALSGSLGHFASGVMLLIFRPYKVGDLVMLAGQTGDVEEVQMFNTVLRTQDNKRIIIPNSLVTGSIISNISGQGEIRVDMDYAVGNEANMNTIRAAIQEVADACPTLLKTKPVDIYVNGAAPGGTKLLVRPWCKSEHYWDTYFFFQEGIRDAFGRHHIPEPKLEVTVA